MLFSFLSYLSLVLYSFSAVTPHKMTTIPYQTSPLDPSHVEQVPVFELYARRATNEYEGGITPTMIATHHAGDLVSFQDLESRINKPNTRIEIERVSGIEEIRLIDESTGKYNSAKGDIAKSIIDEWDAREAVFFADPDRLPDGSSELGEVHHKSIVQYDDGGYRILPAFRKKGEVHSKEEFWGKHGDYSYLWAAKGAAAVVDTRTGEFWVATADVAKEMDEDMRNKRPRTE
ncbi:hypothetical protein BCR39DRAFT_586202 [Naematelia encephala]|uniref:Uncharacterized protein n=1 Tax=Naematelia encephala TaxID=71784 RepID=A0A1Y2BIT5_9TREE|nr:hypothetical protein BCR39DRAFT_586202 [Naematelia encephala]